MDKKATGGCGESCGLIKSTTDNAPTPTFEEAMAELEVLINKLEDGKLPLEETIEAYTRGTHLVRLCRAKIEDAEARVRRLEEDTADSSSGQ